MGRVTETGCAGYNGGRMVGLGPQAAPVTGKDGARRGLTRLMLRDVDLFPRTNQDPAWVTRDYSTHSVESPPASFPLSGPSHALCQVAFLSTWPCGHYPH